MGAGAVKDGAALGGDRRNFHSIPRSRVSLAVIVSSRDVRYVPSIVVFLLKDYVS